MRHGDVTTSAQFSEKRALEIGTLISMNTQWATKPQNPVSEGGVHNRSGDLIRHGNGKAIASEMIDHDQDTFAAPRRHRPHFRSTVHIDVNELKPS